MIQCYVLLRGSEALWFHAWALQSKKVRFKIQGKHGKQGKQGKYDLEQVILFF